MRSVDIGWHDIAWRPRILRGAPVATPACRRPGFGWSVDVFKRDGLQAVDVRLAATIPLVRTSHTVLPVERPRIQFPTL